MIIFEIITALLVAVLILGAIVFVFGRRVMRFNELGEPGVDPDAIIGQRTVWTGGCHSAKKPAVSGPRHLVDEARKLKKKKTP